MRILDVRVARQLDQAIQLGINDVVWCRSYAPQSHITLVGLDFCMEALNRPTPVARY